MRKLKYNLNLIQLDFNNGLSWSEIKTKYGISRSLLAKYVKKGILKSNKNNKNQWRNSYKFTQEILKKISETSSLRKHSEETKKKISEARIRFLTANPDKVPYVVNHSSKKSWPEEVFENALKSSSISGWIYKYRHGIYEYDFAFPKLKIDVEVDGGTHKTEKVKKIDIKRDDFSYKNGWSVLRFDAEIVKKDVISCITKLKEFIRARGV